MHTLWITGIPGAGKTLLALTIERRLLMDWGQKCVVIDGDGWREAHQNKDHSLEGRRQNIRRMAEFAQTLNDLGYLVFIPTCSPQANLRAEARSILRSFHEVHLDCTEDQARKRVPERYELADTGVYQNYPVVHTPFEPPVQPELYIDGELSMGEVADSLFSYVVNLLGSLR